MWYCLPLLCSHQPSAVSELALVTVRALRLVDPAHTVTILQAIAYNSYQDNNDKGVDKDNNKGLNKGSDKGLNKDKERATTANAYSTRARASWLAVVTEPRLVQSLARHR